jgi:Protein of unknown function (DUF2442)
VRYRIISATANRDHTVDLAWSNGRRARVDFQPIIGQGGALSPLRDIDFFCDHVAIAQDGRALEWPGELDFSADSLIYRAFPDLQESDGGSQSAAE